MRAVRTLFPRILPAMLCGFLAIITPASVDAAWVLWLDFTQISGDKTEQEWMTVSAHRSEEACEESLKETMAFRSQVAPGETADTRGKHPVSKDGAPPDIFLRYVCLPDTVDPRGMNGK